MCLRKPSGSLPHASARGALYSVLLDLDPHGAAGPHDLAYRSLEVLRVQVPHLRLRDLLQVGARDRADRLAARRARALREPHGLPDEDARGRRLQDEVEAPVDVDGELDGNGRSLELARPLVELGDELPDVDTVLAERGTDRRRRGRLSSRQLELDLGLDFLFGRRHAYFLGSDLLHLPVLEIDRCGPAEDRDDHPHLTLPPEDLIHGPIEVLEGALLDLHTLPGLEVDLHLGSLVLRLQRVQDLLDL